MKFAMQHFAFSLFLVLLVAMGTPVVHAESPSSDHSHDIAILEAEIAKLLAQIATLTQNIANSTSTPKMTVVSFERNLGLGDIGPDVALLQEVLATDHEVYPEAKVTGTYGGLTERAVRRFQEKQGLSVVGHVGPRTRDLLNRYVREGKVKEEGRVPSDLLQKSRTFTVLPLFPQNGSVMKGWAKVIEGLDGRATVEIELQENGRPASSTHPAFLRLGSCPTPNYAVSELEPIVSGRSVTLLKHTYQELLERSALSINIHRSRGLDSIDLACGEVVIPQGIVRWDGKS
jgi:peptidoglycan hydrolase-like protein with peptidoglycan-binding domain